jgi:hypothetical protein
MDKLDKEEELRYKKWKILEKEHRSLKANWKKAETLFKSDFKAKHRAKDWYVRRPAKVNRDPQEDSNEEEASDVGAD